MRGRRSHPGASTGSARSSSDGRRSRLVSGGPDAVRSLFGMTGVASWSSIIEDRSAASDGHRSDSRRRPVGTVEPVDFHAFPPISPGESCRSTCQHEPHAGAPCHALQRKS
jgi:hypothetical protein